MASYPKVVTLSYVLDILVMVAFGLISFGFSKITPRYHPFSLLDLSISYPYRSDTVSDLNLDLVSILAPAVIIVIVSLVFVPAPIAARKFGHGPLSYKIWELLVGLLGLALCHTTQIMIVSGLKNLIGKPRPDMLARCIPDLTNISQHAVGGFGDALGDFGNAGWMLVDQKICTQTNQSHLKDGFRSFPSGHSSTSFAGMLYLSLYLCSKFAISWPIFPRFGRFQQRSRDEPFVVFRNEAAAAPAWLLFLAYTPIGVAMYIAASRFFDYRHHGFDILSGSVIGIVCAYFAFRYYHVPLGQGAGWAWGPRCRDRAFGMSIGKHGYSLSEEEEDEILLADVESASASGRGRPDGSMSRGLLNASGSSEGL